jgi:hypothetical protein
LYAGNRFMLIGDRIFPNVTTKSSLLIILIFMVESKTLMTLPV